MAVNALKYIGRMLILSLILTVVVNLLLLTVRFFPFEIFTDWIWRFELGGVVVIIPWFAMLAVSVGLTLVQMFVRRKNSRR